MTQEKANEIFNSDLGMQLSSFFSTSDGRCFIREGEAVAHTNTLLNANPQEQVDTTIKEWFYE